MTQLLDVELCVTRIRHAGQAGGVIIYGQTDSREHYAARLTWRHVPDARVVDIGQRWRVIGMAGSVTLAQYDGSGSRRDVQIEAEDAQLIWPSGKHLQEWIAKSQQCPGIGLQKARAMYEALGPALVSHIEQRRLPELMSAGRLTMVQAQSLCDAFSQFQIGSTLLWLDQLRIPRAIGNKVVRYWGRKAISTIEANPYVLVSFEADWRKVDELARTRFAVASNDPRRLQSAIEETLYRCQNSGHTCLPAAKFSAALWCLLKSHKLVALAMNNPNPDTASYVRVGNVLQSAGMNVIETYLAERFRSLVRGINESGQASLFGQNAWDLDKTARIISDYEAVEGITLNAEQRSAVELASRSHLALVIGPAGTGKTTVLKAMRRVVSSFNSTGAIYQLAPTGLAAQRMQMATGQEGSTIHWFLLNVKTEDIAMGSVVIIDEASMLDVLLAYRLFRHLPEGVRVVMVGDTGQLPPVGPGLILHALADSALVPKVRLTKVLRQQESTGIPIVANQIREGILPLLPRYSGLGSGVSFLECSEGKLDSQISELYEALQGSSNFDVQVLSPVRSGPGSVRAINTVMHEAYRKNDRCATLFNPVYGEVWAMTRARLHLKEHDKVMYTVNDYALGLRNGSLGFVEQVRHADILDAPVLTAVFEGVRVELNATDLENVTHAYGITIHKSQGSQFKRVIVVLKRSRVFAREALYTALTRGVEQVVLLGSMDVLKEALLQPLSSQRRHTMLGVLLQFSEEVAVGQGVE